MGDIPQLIRIAVALKIQPNDGPVFFKVDGSRFGQNRTIKLLTGSKYKIEVVVKPGAVEATTMSIGGISFPLEQQSKDPQSVVYNGTYDTEGVTHTKSGERQPVQVSIQVIPICIRGRNCRSVLIEFSYIHMCNERREKELACFTLPTPRIPAPREKY
uniref:CB1 cannabinoid receptor-interacting protein 1 n=1 Tax=Paramormyrops kingsleyae TaxID=1676925 RepID=A0A3B3RQH2_9TELE